MIAKSRKAVKDEKKYNLLQTRIQLRLNTISKKCEQSACFHGEFSLWCRKSKAFVKVHLHCIDKRNVDVAPPGKISADAHQR